MVRLEVEDSRDCVAANSLLVDRAFNLVNRILDCLIPKIRKLPIPLSSAISRLAKDSGSLCSVVDRSLHSQRAQELSFLTVTFVTHRSESLSLVV